MDIIQESKSVFEILNAINCNEHVEKKNGLTYLSWAWAWQIVKKYYPTAQYTIYENAQGLNYHHDGRTAWVKTGVTIEGIEHIEYLPVMDSRNRSIPLDILTSFDINKAIQRSLTKAAARHGLGLYIYAGEDLPDDAADAQNTAVSAASKTKTTNVSASGDKPAKTPQKREKQTITRAMVESGAATALVEWLRETQPGTADRDARTSKMLAGYKWDSMDTYNRIISLADAK